MIKENSIEKRMNIFAITIPIFAENILKFLFSFVDMFMLSNLTINGVRFGDDAVGSVGLVTSFVFFILIFYMMISSGTSIVVSQYNGAKKPANATQTVVASIILTLLFGIILSITMYFLAKPIISIYRLSEIRFKFAVDYLTIYGAFSLGLALNTIFSAILRSYGYSKEPMFINIFANIINVFGNYCLIFGKFGFPQLGVSGAAISTVFSLGVSAVFMFLILMNKKDIAFPYKDFFKLKFQSIKEILNIGVPTGGENLSYNIAMIVMNFFVAHMDYGLPPEAQINLPAYNYSFIFARFILFFGLSTGYGTQIITSYLVGANNKDKAYHKVIKYFYFSFVLSFLIAVVLSIFRKSILNIFPMERNVFTLCSSLILFTMLLEPGRAFNLIIISGLKGAGDIHFPVKMGIVSMWGIGVLFAFLFGIVFKLGVIGIWLGISMDEWTRGIIMYFRWNSKIWQKKTIINMYSQPV